jgi:uncharacterized membrane protein
MPVLYGLLAVWPVVVTVALVLLWVKVADPRTGAEIARLRAEVARLARELEQMRRTPAREGPPTAARAPEPPERAPVAPAEPRIPIPSPVMKPSPTTPFPSVPHEPPRQPESKWQPSFELESLIGGNWLLKIGVLAIVLGTVYFIKYAFESRWIGNTGRVIIGAFTGLAFVGAGELFHRRGYLRYGPSIAAGGICILYLSVYAAFNFYTLIGNAPALVLMTLITASGALLSARYPSKTLAVLSLLGGIMTPYWLSTGQNNQVGLLTYLLILDLGMGVLARTKNWDFLNWVSLAGTVSLFAAWASRFYTTAASGVTEWYLALFGVLYISLPVSATPGPATGRVRSPLPAVAVVLFFFASEANLQHNAAWYWVFIALFAALAAAWTLWRRDRLAVNGAFLLIVIGVAVWFPEHYHHRDAYTVALFATVAFAIFVAQQVVGSRWSSTPAGYVDIYVTLSTALGYFGVMYSVLRPLFPDSMGLMAVALSVLYLVLVQVARAPISHALLGTSLSFLTTAIPIQFDSSWITVGWSAEAVVLCWIGFEGRSPRLRQASLAVLALSLVRLLNWDMLLPLPRYVFALNRRALAFGAVIVAFYVVAWFYRRHRDALGIWEHQVRTVLLVMASAITVLLISIENWAYFTEQLRAGGPGSDAFATRSSRQMFLSVFWGGYSIAAVSFGISRRYRPIRLFGIALFFLAIFKVFTIDIWLLQRLYRIVSVISLGCLLLAVAFLYQRFSRSVTGSR